MLLILTCCLPPTEPAAPISGDDGTSPVAWIGRASYRAGKISRDVEFQHVFHFRNLTNEDLLVYNIRTGCGCTSSDWEDVPVAPGATGSIKVTYDATNGGYFRKCAKVFFVGHRGGHKLCLEGFVE